MGRPKIELKNELEELSSHNEGRLMLNPVEEEIKDLFLQISNY